MKAVVISVFSVSADFAARDSCFSARSTSIAAIAMLSPVAMTLSLYAFSFFRTLRSFIFWMKLNGIRYVWSRKTVFFFINVDASLRRTSIYLEPTVVYLIQKLSTMPPFSPLDILL